MKFFEGEIGLAHPPALYMPTSIRFLLLSCTLKKLLSQFSLIFSPHFVLYWSLFLPQLSQGSCDAHLCAPHCIFSVTMNSFICSNSLKGVVHPKISTDLMDYHQRSGGRAPHSLTESHTIVSSSFAGPFFPPSSCSSLTTLIIKFDITACVIFNFYPQHRQQYIYCFIFTASVTSCYHGGRVSLWNDHQKLQ